jgi:hypothetical protein
MAKIYKYLITQERAVIMTMRADLSSTQSIAKRLCRSASTISRELATGGGRYDADLAHAQCHARRLLPRRLPKLHTDGALFMVVRHQLKLLWSPQKIARKLKALWLYNSKKSVSHETICNAIYLHPRGELKRELIACLRHHNQVRKPCSRGDDRRYQIQDMQSIHIRPAEVEDRAVAGHDPCARLLCPPPMMLLLLGLQDPVNGRLRRQILAPVRQRRHDLAGWTAGKLGAVGESRICRRSPSLSLLAGASSAVSGSSDQAPWPPARLPVHQRPA